MERSKTIMERYKEAVSSCRAKKGALCGSLVPLDVSEGEPLLLATGPQTYDSRAQNIRTPVKEQGSCYACVPFAVAAAAEAAVIKALGPTAQHIDLSEQDIGFCSDKASLTSCSTGTCWPPEPLLIA